MSCKRVVQSMGLELRLLTLPLICCVSLDTFLHLFDPCPKWESFTITIQKLWHLWMLNAFNIWKSFKWYISTQKKLSNLVQTQFVFLTRPYFCGVPFKIHSKIEGKVQKSPIYPLLPTFIASLIIPPPKGGISVNSWWTYTDTSLSPQVHIPYEGSLSVVYILWVWKMHHDMCPSLLYHIK